MSDWRRAKPDGSHSELSAAGGGSASGRRPMRRVLCALALVLLALTGIAGPAYADGLTIRKVDTTKFPTPARLFTIGDLGGWSTVNASFFDPTSGSISRIENSLGVAGG